MTQAAPEPVKSRLPLWPLLYCVTPVLLALGLLLLVNQPRRGNPPPENTPPPKSQAVPELGSGSSNVEPAAQRPPHEDPQPAANAPEEEPPEAPPPVEAQAGEREIEIHIKNLKFAIQHNNARGRHLESNWLIEAKPRELVVARLQLSAEGEGDSRVRLAFFNCLADAAVELAWARRLYAKWAARFLGTDTQLEAGNIDEFSAYARALFAVSPLTDAGLDLARNALSSAKPDWLLAVLADSLAWGKDNRQRVAPIWPELGRLLEAGGGGDSRELLFVAWSHHFESMDELLRALSDARLHGCLVALLNAQAIARGMFSSPENAALLAFTGNLLASKESEPIRAALIRALAATLPNAAAEIRPIIEAGLARRDANLADYIEAFGKLAAKPSELKRLAEYANDPDAAIARGAVNGLRQSAARAADDELRLILNVGSNNGVKADALAALLARNPDSRERLISEYLGEDKPASLRAIAVAYLSDKQLDRLKELGESDPELRVREAAINRLGALKDKSLKTWFTRVSRSDTSPALRQLARKYAAELN